MDAGAVFLRSISGEIHSHTVTSVSSHKNVFLMKLEGVTSRDEAEKYKGADILIRKEALTREDDEYFWYELLGLNVYLENGEYLGSLSQIIPTGSNDIYVVSGGNKEILIPGTYEAVKEIDLDKGRMIVSAMEGLLNLNEV